jgi:hypothetical protein
MPKSKTVRVTPNVQKCLEILKLATESMPAGELKRRAEAALGYLSRTFKGDPQPHKGILCTPDKPVVI